MKQPPDLTGPHGNPLKNLLGQKKEDPRPIDQVIEQKPEFKHPG